MKAPAPMMFLPLLLAFPAAAQEEGVRDELTRLFDQVHKDLKEIDRLLLDAGKERDAAEKSAEAISGMRKILEQAQGRERSVVQAIEEILRKAPT